jgi:hypothetical protein
MRPICVVCHRFFKPIRNGFYFIEGMPLMEHPDSRNAKDWKPYKLWSGDVWECPGCQATIIVGTGKNPIAEHYQDDFHRKCEQLHADFQVNDL